MPVDALMITAPIRIGICINADNLVNNPMVIKKPHNKCIHVTTNATQSGKKLKLLPASNALNDIISLINEIPLEVRAIPRAARSNNKTLGCVELHLSICCRVVIKIDLEELRNSYKSYTITMPESKYIFSLWLQHSEYHNIANNNK